ncbi:MAG: hypothetical protein OXH76_09095, partial [Boseongicola sp.]|nr:hypothetical protein [Boseongicola sp.]
MVNQKSKFAVFVATASWLIAQSAVGTDATSLNIEHWDCTRHIPGDEGMLRRLDRGPEVTVIGDRSAMEGTISVYGLTPRETSFFISNGDIQWWWDHNTDPDD